MTAAWGNVTDRMLLQLRDHGPATRSQLQDALGISGYQASRVITRLMRVVKRGEHIGQRRIHIAGWTRDQEGARNYLRAIYAYGDGKDARCPGPKCRLLAKREYWARRKMRVERFGPGQELQQAWQSASGCQPAHESTTITP